MVKPSDLVRPPPQCPTPTKRAYRSKAAARHAHRDSYWYSHTFHRGCHKPKLWPYLCKCSMWHLTHHDPEKQKRIQARAERKTGRAPGSPTVPKQSKTVTDKQEKL